MLPTNLFKLRVLISIPLFFAFGCETGTNDKVDLGNNPFGAVDTDRPIQEIVAQTFVLQDFEALLVASRVSGELDSPPYTFFAPWDAAFEKQPYWTKITKNKAWYGHLRDLVLSHIHKGNLSKDDLDEGMSITMLNGDVAKVTKQQTRPRVDDIRIIADVTGKDGHIFMLDEVREPKWTKRTILDIINEDDRFTTLAAILKDPSMSQKREELSQTEASSFFAPTNAALAGFDMNECMEDSDCLTKLNLLVENHLVVGAVIPRLFTATQGFTTLSGSTLDWNFGTKTIACTNDDNSRQETALEIDEEHAINGLIHPIDTLLCTEIGLPTWSADTLAQLRRELTEQIPPSDQVTDAALEALLTSDSLDEKLVRYVVLHEATPVGLETFTQQGDRQAFLISKMLKDTDLMKQMLVADGAKIKKGQAQYGPAMEIYEDIQQASSLAATGVLQRLALAIALEHSIPIAQTNPQAQTDGPETIDPVQRYLHYEKAFLDGELDPLFDSLSTWELRFVVNGDEPDDILAWGREMLRNYRPDIVQKTDYTWRYVYIVRTDIDYGLKYAKYDWPELHKYQNILMHGGICGRQAFFGRFILRAFGIPTTARPTRAHGALTHWTPDGWVINLSSKDWGNGWTTTLYHDDLDFLATTQARVHTEAFMKVKRAQWIGDVMGETRTYGEHDDGTPAFWNGVSLRVQRAIIDQAQTEGGDESGDDDDKDTPDTFEEEITTGADGIISIPAAVYNKEESSSWVELRAMTSHDGGRQIFLPSFGPAGHTILRGGSWSDSWMIDADADYSGTRLLGKGYDNYADWGLRAAMTPNTDSPPNEVTLDLGGGVTMEFVYIDPGMFVMGGERTTVDEWFQCVEVPKHEVTLTRGFYLGKYEVTQAQYEAIMGSNPSRSTIAPDNPVDSVTDVDAFLFIEQLAEKTQREVRLPTEAEWEYASRAGQDTKWFFGDDPSLLGEYAWFQDNAGAQSHAVGQKKPNQWGLYDMYGNVWERISDRYSEDYYATSPKEDPTGTPAPTSSHIEYTVTVPQSGQYTLTAQVVTIKYDQILNVSVNDVESKIAIELPFTLGAWQESEPVTLTLQAGENTLRFWRDQAPQKGMAIKSFTLTPVSR